MRLTALGVYGPFPRAGSACSGYVVETGETRILLDCGSGVFSRPIWACCAMRRRQDGAVKRRFA